MDIIKSIEHEQMKSKIPYLKVGDTVKVHVRVKEGNRERIQVFEGIVIKKQGGGVNATFTVRKTSYGVGVEKTFLIHSPAVDYIANCFSYIYICYTRNFYYISSFCFWNFNFL